MGILKNKKANAVIEAATIITVLFVLAIISVTGMKLFSEMNTEIQQDADMSNSSKTLITTQHNTYPKLFDGLFMFILVGLWIAAITFSFMIDTHPIFLVLSIILIVFILFIAAALSNAYEDVIGDDDLVTASDNFPMTNFVFSHLLETILVIAMSIVITLFAKSKVS